MPRTQRPRSHRVTLIQHSDRMAKLKSGAKVPAKGEVRVEGRGQPGQAASYLIRFEAIDGRLRPVGVYVKCGEGRPYLRPSDFAALTDELVNSAAAGLVYLDSYDRFEWSNTDGQPHTDPRELASASAAQAVAHQPRRRQRLDDVFLQEVVRIYGEAVRSNRHPVLEVAVALGGGSDLGSRRNARRWVKRCRDLGNL
jgi:hypothetical protein